MDIDTLGRRTRIKRQSTGKIVRAMPRDLLWLEKLHHHGPLPTSYLHEFTAHLAKDRARTLKRLAALHHEVNLLTRPTKQFDTMDARYNQLVYDLGDSAIQVLRDEGSFSSKAPVCTGPWKHRVMVSCITASIDLATHGTNIRYIHQHEILDQLGVSMRIPITLRNDTLGRDEQHDLIPDAMFGLEYKSGDQKSYIFFLVEADRGTEPLKVKNLARKSYLRSIQQYRKLVGAKLYKEHFGLNAGLLVLNVTTSTERMNNLIELVGNSSDSGRNTYMLFQTAPMFGTYFKPPQPMPALFSAGWYRAGHDPFHLGQP